MNNLEKISVKVTNWVGTPASIVVHTLLFAFSFALSFFGVGLDSILLILTTVVSLEAIYLAIFIQMTVNRNTTALEEVVDDIDEIQEDVEEIQEDVEDIQEDDSEEEKEAKEAFASIDNIEEDLRKLMKDIEVLKQRNIKNA